jgi:hypothetical protein
MFAKMFTSLLYNNAECITFVYCRSELERLLMFQTQNFISSFQILHCVRECDQSVLYVYGVELMAPCFIPNPQSKKTSFNLI